MRIVVGILLVLVLVAGGWAMTNQSYRAGYAQGVAQSGNAPAPGPGAPPYPMYGYPYHGPGPFFGFFGFFWVLLFIFLLSGLFRGLFWRGGWHGHGPWGRGAPPAYEEWHRRAHEKGSTGTV